MVVTPTVTLTPFHPARAFRCVPSIPEHSGAILAEPSDPLCAPRKPVEPSDPLCAPTRRVSRRVLWVMTCFHSYTYRGRGGSTVGGNTRAISAMSHD